VNPLEKTLAMTPEGPINQNGEALPPDGEPFDLGRVLVREGLLSEAQLDKAIRVQAKLAGRRWLGDVLCELGFVYRNQIKELMRRFKQRFPFGEVLCELGLADLEAVERARARQKAGDRRRLGEILVEEGVLDEAKVLRALCEQLDIPLVDPRPELVDPALLKGFAKGFFEARAALPLASEEGSMLSVALADPTDKRTLDEIAAVLGRPVAAAGALRERILDVLKTLRQRPAERAGAPFRGESGTQREITPRGENGSDGAASELVAGLIRRAVEERASDIHFETLPSKVRVRFRIDGSLVQRTDLPKEIYPRVVSHLKVLAGADIAERRRHQDGAIRTRAAGNDLDLRVSFFVTMHGENVTIRILNQRAGLVSLEELGMAPRTLQVYRESVLDLPSGVVIVTGPTGSGKTTTLYSSIAYCNDPSRKIITVEDPVEYQIDGIAQCQVNMKAGLDFHDTLRAVVRQDPDIVVIGEIRDRTTAETAIQAALTGHKVLSTFHTEDSVGGILRLIGMEMEPFLLSSTVVAVLAQRLVRRVCTGCGRPDVPPAAALAKLGAPPEYFRGFDTRRGRGCGLCYGTGYRGRIGLYELLLLTESVREAILEKRQASQIRAVSVSATGLVSMAEDGLAKVARGITTVEEVLENAPRVPRVRPLREIFALTG
jgi:type IV pilus assembly protein PilB